MRNGFFERQCIQKCRTGAYQHEIVCRGLPYQTTEHDLIELFEQIGQVTEVSVITDRDTGRSKGFGFVEMSDQQAAQAAIEQLNGTLLGDRTITVNEARERQTVGSRSYQGRERRSNNGYRSERY